MIRVVVDTNVLISAMLNPVGYPSVVIHTIITSKNIQWFVIDKILSEYETVIRRPKFDLHSDIKNDFIELIHTNIIIVDSKEKVAILSDEADNRFLECAQESEAHFLITGNRRDFSMIYFRKTKIVSPRQFMELILGTC